VDGLHRRPRRAWTTSAEAVQNWEFGYVDQLPRTVRAYDAETDKLVFCEN